MIKLYELNRNKKGIVFLQSLKTSGFKTQFTDTNEMNLIMAQALVPCLDYFLLHPLDELLLKGSPDGF